MKNFKLLLATTALLSTGFAMGVLADDEPSTATLNVHVGIVAVDEIIPIQDIDFGTFILREADFESDFTRTMNAANGSVNADGHYHIGNYETKNGQVMLTMLSSSPKKILLPENVTLFDYNRHEIDYAPSFTEIDTKEHDEFTKKIYGIGGTLHSSVGVYGLGDYTGELTVTVIADTGE